MISCVTWVPKGAADPKPKRYEMSTAELELMKDYVNMDESLLQEEEEDGGEEEIEEEVEEEEETPQKVELPKIDPSTLPPELRMDDYSDDEEDEGKKNAAREAMIGSMLIGKVSSKFCFWNENVLLVILCDLCDLYTLLIFISLHTHLTLFINQHKKTGCHVR